VSVLDVDPNNDPEVSYSKARRLVEEIDSGDGVLVLTDVFGATPGNIAARLLESSRVAVVAGVNLPMLLRTLCYRTDSLEQTVEKALAGGTQGVVHVSGDAMQDRLCRAMEETKEDDQTRLHH
jgi:PTS system ascorbate-specific IIA component